MINLSNLFPENLYHSYVIEGDPKRVSVLLLDFLYNNNYIKKNDSDLLYLINESFTIENSRAVINWHNNTNTTNNKKICIIGGNFINNEAQQSLLKIIEEPKNDNHFFIITPNSSLLYDTLLSRVNLIKINDIYSNEEMDKINDFIKMSPKERIEEISNIIKIYKDNPLGLKSFAVSFVNKIEYIYHQKILQKKTDRNLLFILKEIEKSKNFLNIKGAGVKMILEHLSLVI